MFFTVPRLHVIRMLVTFRRGECNQVEIIYLLLRLKCHQILMNIVFYTFKMCSVAKVYGWMLYSDIVLIPVLSL